MGETKDKKSKKETVKKEEIEFLLQLNVAEDIEEAENELEDTYREFQRE